MERHARAAAWVLFVLTGLVFGSWAASIPAVQQRLGLTAAALGLVAVVLEGAAVVGLLLGGALVGRLGSRIALRLALLVFATGLVGLATAPTFGALLAVVGGVFSGGTLLVAYVIAWIVMPEA